MKAIFTLVAILLSSHCLFSQASNTVLHVYSLPTNTDILSFELPSNKVEIIKTKSARITIETTVLLPVGTPPLLDYLIKSKRYDLKATIDRENHSFTLSPIKLQKTLIIKGEVCQEDIRYKIYVPESIDKVTNTYSALTASAK